MSMDEEDPWFLCIFCKSEQNYINNDAALQSYLDKRKELDNTRKNIDREHLLQSKPYAPGQFYLPQIGDEVIYFF